MNANNINERIAQHLEVLYPQCDCEALSKQVLEAILPYRQPQAGDNNAITEADCLLITYADSIIGGNATPLSHLKRFVDEQCEHAISAVHILPFTPYSSDDGFSVIDYRKVKPDLGSWQEIAAISEHFKLMVDLVINHVSAESDWFQDYCAGKRDAYFIEVTLDDDLSQVVRPRASPLLRATETVNGVKQLWCTFSHDQVDVNFKNPEVLLEYLRIVGHYLQNGARVIRLDAIGYLWKQTGTSCIHLPQTHEVVRLLRTVCEFLQPGTVLITETNVPNHENLSYFGNRNEAHAIYNFSLPPLLVHALLTGESKYLKTWMMTMPPSPDGCSYLNFTASHDGIGMRPAEGLLSDHEQLELTETIRKHGGLLSTRRGQDGNERIYELNISLWDAFQGTTEGLDEYQFERFLCSQTVMMGVEGVPAFYIHSLLATPNDHLGVEATGRNRSINRVKWDVDELNELLADPASMQSRVLSELIRQIKIRGRQPAFHPNATQFTLQVAEPFFAFWRQSRDRAQSVFAIHNLTRHPQQLRLSELNLISIDQWQDLLSGQPLEDRTGVISVQPYQCLWISNRDGPVE